MQIEGFRFQVSPLPLRFRRDRRQVSGVSGTSGREHPFKSNERLMNIEHRTSNIEHRIMYSIYFKTTERSDSTPPPADQSTFVIRHLPKFHKSGGLRLKDSWSDQRKETNERRTSNVQHRTPNNACYLF